MRLTRYQGANARPFARTGPDLEAPISETRALGHADEPEAAAARRVIGNETLALVLYTKLDVFRRHRNMHLALNHPSMLGDVS